MTGHGWLVHGPAKWGMDWLGIEIGENIDATQLHIAFQRGAARMYNLPTHADISHWHAGTVPDYIAGIDEYTAIIVQGNVCYPMNFRHLSDQKRSSSFIEDGAST